MAGKFKVDLSGVQQFFIDKGDKIALALCVLAAGLLVTMGVLDAASVRTAPNSTQPYAQSMQSAAKTLKDKVDNAPVDDTRVKDPAANFKAQRWVWDLADLGFPFAKFFDMADSGSSKRLNPRVVPVLAGPESVAMWYVPGCYFAYDINAAKGKQNIVVFQPAANAANPAPQPVPGMKKNAPFQGQPAIVTRPMRMVVVNCVFPMREQLLEFQNSFRMQSQAELFASKDLPRVLGINIWKREVQPGKEAAWKPLVVAAPDKVDGEMKVEVDESLKKLFREALLDEENLALYSPFLLQGLTMPLPRLAILPTGQYPPLKLAGLEVDDNAPPGEGMRGDGMGRMGGVGGGAGGKQFNPFDNKGGRGAGAGMGKDLERNDDFPWRNLNKDLQDKLNDRTNVLDPQLVNFDSEDEKKDAEPGLPRQQNMLEGFFQGNSIFAAQVFWTRYPKPPMPVMAGGKEAPKHQAAAVAKPYDALVRFVDPTVEAGKTYQYMVQVRMANPNFGKKEDVAFPALADLKELPPSPPVETPTITIPEEYYLYAVNEQPKFKVTGGSAWDAPKEKDPYRPEHVAVQIHRWVDEARQNGGRDQAIGDWCIAERIYIRRGDPVGKEINVEVPTWNSEENRFQLGKAVAENAGPNPKTPPPAMIRKGPVMMAPPPPPGGTGGIPVNFAVTTPPPVLVDFDGGKRELRVGVTATTSGTSYKDESASNLLILRADGTLIVRNTRVDSETASQQGKERMQRIETWRMKTQPLRDLGNPGNPGMPFRPNPAGIFGNKS